MKRSIVAMILGLIVSNPVDAQWVMAKVEVIVDKSAAAGPLCIPLSLHASVRGIREIKVVAVPDEGKEITLVAQVAEPSIVTESIKPAREDEKPVDESDEG